MIFMDEPEDSGGFFLEKLKAICQERTKLIELALELVWELQTIRPSELRKQQEMDLEAMRA